MPRLQRRRARNRARREPARLSALRLSLLAIRERTNRPPVGIQQVVDSFFRGLREVIIAVRTNALVPGELDFVHDVFATGAFLKKSLWDIAAALLSAAATDGRSFENGHGVRRARRSLRART